MFFTYVDWTLEDVSRPFYVGKGDLKRTQRVERNPYWKNIAAKHGWRREIVLATKDESFAFEEEKRRIAELGTFEDGTPGRWGANLTEGGEGASGYKHTDETRMLLSGLRKGKSPWNKGVPHSDDTRAKVSNANKGRVLPPRSDEHRAKLSALRKGKTGESWCQSRPWSQERREQYRGEVHHNYGKTFTEEQRATLQRAKSKLPDELIRTIRSSDESLRSLSQRYGLSVMTISRIKRRLRYQWVV